MFYAVYMLSIDRDVLDLPKLVITSANDSIHIKNSKHYRNLAIDIRTKDLTYTQKVKYIQLIKSNMGVAYEIIVYKDHIHIEYAY